MREKIAVIAGTTESRRVVESLLKEGANIIACVATELGTKMLEGYPITICEGRMDREQFRQFFIEKEITRVVDVSHPFAKIVTETVREVCEALSLPYQRIKRETQAYDYDKIIWAKDAQEAAKLANQQEGMILLTTGANTAAVYAKTVSKMEDRLYIRVLDTKKSLEICQEAGILREHIIAKMPPFSIEDNIQLIEKINATVLVSKESGRQGGVREKVEACRRKQIPIILIKRPESDEEVL